MTGQSGGRSEAGEAGTARPGGLLVPLRHATFRRVWGASLVSNLGLLINSVGASWAMTQLSGDSEMVALVQTALMLPYLLIAIPAGAICDTYDRRKVGIFALCCAAVTSSLLFVSALLGLLTPHLLLALCLLTGTANALFGPAWMSSAGEQLPPEDLAQGIALNGVSYNIARAFGPAVGGILVALWGPVAAFAGNAASYLPMLWAQVSWRRDQEPARLPPEHAGRAILSGIRYVLHSPPIKQSIVRSILFGMAGASIQALMPVVARDFLSGGPSTYGTLLGFFGIGAVMGATLISRVRTRFSMEQQITGSLCVLAIAVATIATSRRLEITCLVLFLAGMAWMQVTNTLSVSIQARAPRWVSGRTVAGYQASIAGGLAIGSWVWGRLADLEGAMTAFCTSAAALLLVALLGKVMPIPPIDEQDRKTDAMLAEPETLLELAGESGPITVLIEYEVPAIDARYFIDAMYVVRAIRLRSGAYGWSLACDISRPELWVERFQCPTWHDYLRQRRRMTEVERQQILALVGEPTRVSRYVDRSPAPLRTG